MMDNLSNIYSSSQFFYYPYLENLLTEAQALSENDCLQVDLNSLYKRSPDSLLSKVNKLFQSFIHALKLILSNGYKEKFNRSVTIIKRSVDQEFNKQETERKNQEAIKAQKIAEEKLLNEKKDKASRIIQNIFRGYRAKKRFALYKEEKAKFYEENQLWELLQQYKTLESQYTQLPPPPPKSWLSFFQTEDQNRVKAKEELESLKNKILSNPTFFQIHEQNLNCILKKIETLKNELFNLQGPIKDNVLVVEEPKKEINPNKQAMLDGIAAHMNDDMKHIWEQLFAKFDENIVKNWKCVNGKFEIQLEHPIKMWVPSTNKEGVEDPLGGVILMFGNKDNIIKGKIDKKAMNFDQGSFTVYLQYVVPLPKWLGGGEKYLTPDVFRLAYESYDKVLFKAGITIAGHQFGRDREKSVPNLLTNWGDNGIAVTSDHHQFLVQQIAKAKRNT